MSANIRLCGRLWQTDTTIRGIVIMSSLLLVVLISFVAWYWVKNTRIQRQRWLKKLDLPGVWVCRLPDKVSTRLEFRGTTHEGSYVEFEGDTTIEGQWRLEAHTLTLERPGGGFPLELRLFDEGKIGLDRPDGTQRIYFKKQTKNNVVDMRSRK